MALKIYLMCTQTTPLHFIRLGALFSKKHAIGDTPMAKVAVR